MTLQSEQTSPLEILRAPTSRPGSTYRVQFHQNFTFQHAAAIVPYLAKLGISHLYASPYLQAAPGSTHGYDVVDPESLNSECGTADDYQALLDTLRDHGMSHILDIVPNHMGVGTDQNPWWNDVLEFGPSSLFANFFDITWETSSPDLRAKLILPILGDELEQTVGKGELKLVFDDAGFALQYYERRLPITPASYGLILNDFAAREWPEHGIEHYRMARSLKDEFLATSTEQREGIQSAVAEINDPANTRRLLELIRAQHYSLAFWREAAAINYRRFFDINDLAALQMEREEVFERTHATILNRLAGGEIAGVRVDHPDGLANPKRYFERLQTAFARERAKALDPTLARRTTVQPDPSEKPLYIVGEKILAFDESLDETWPIDGTSGYDFIAKVNPFFVCPQAHESLSRFYREFTGCSDDFESLAFGCKRLVLRSSFAGELASIVFRVERVARHILKERCPSTEQLEEAVAELIVHFPVYRSYLTDAEASDSDRHVVEAAIKTMRQQRPDVSPDAAGFLRDLLLNQGEFAAQPEFRKQRWPIVRRFQQLTAPVTAKGVEDTAVYRFHRLISLNEVGCEPTVFGLSAEYLHDYFHQRQTTWPHALSTLSTHDTKRSEDVRARLHALADIPDQWSAAVMRWSELNAQALAHANAQPIDRNTEYLIYQTLAGAWLNGAASADEDFVNRIVAYLQKATREAKQFTSWTNPDTDYESRVERFVRLILDGTRSQRFLSDFIPFAQSLSRLGFVNSLSQALIKFTAPGVPDTYQGTELWDFSLVDPDNRRPVDYAMRDKMLSDTPDLKAMIESPDDGRLKLHLTQTCLRARAQYRDCFSSGEYVPLEVTGENRDYGFAFARRLGDVECISVVSRFPGKWMPFRSNALLVCPEGLQVKVLPGSKYTNLLTGETLASNEDGLLPLSRLPVALLVRNSPFS